MKKKIFQLINIYNKHSFKFNLFFLLNFFLLSLISYLGYLREQNYLIFVCLFILIFFLNIWLLCILYSKKQPRSSILELILNRSIIKKLDKINGGEIGVFKGSYSSQMLNFFNSKNILLNLYLVDPWKVDKDFKEYGENKLEKAYELVKDKFKDNKNVNILRSSSFDASSKFDDNFFDFIYIDGNHKYKYVKEDLELWFPKVKIGGILFGDDYLRPYGVQKAVKEFTYEKKIIVHFTDNGNQFYFIKD